MQNYNLGCIIKMKVRKLVAPAFALIIFLFLLNLFSETMLRNIFVRYGSIASQIIDRAGTYGDRIDKLEYAVNDILPDNLLFGVGLYHTNHYSDYLRENVYPDGHIGIFYILVTTGIIFWMIYFGFVFYILIRYIKYFALLRDPVHKSILFMTFSSILTKLIAWHYQEFQDPIGITVFAFVIGLSELAIYYDKKESAQSDENLTYSLPGNNRRLRTGCLQPN